MARNRLEEIWAVRARKGAYGARHNARAAISQLHRALAGGDRPDGADYIPIRLVTALEVFTRECVSELVDHGDPYIERARGLIKDFKFDFDLTRALVGKQVSFGELVSHSISLNSLADLDRAFEILTEQSLTVLLADVHDRWSVEIEGNPPVPIIADVRSTKTVLARLFEARHVLVHEIPLAQPFENEELPLFSAAAEDLAHALSEVVATAIHGKYPLTQLQMNDEARVLAEGSENDLRALLSRLDPDRNDARLQKSQAAWESFREAEATFLSRTDLDPHQRGTIAPLIYWSQRDELNKSRVKWIKDNYREGGGPLGEVR